MKKIILHILNSNSYSGAEKVVITLIEEMKKITDEYDFVYVSPNGTIQKLLIEKSLNFEIISKLSVREIRRVIKKYKPCIIHAHDFTASIISTFILKNIPIISHIHNNSPWLTKYGIKSFAFGLSCLRYKKILGVSSSILKEYVFGKLIEPKFQNIGNPIDSFKIQYLADGAVDKEEYDVCFIGRLSSPKQPLMFVDVVNNIKLKNNHVRAVMIGDGELYEKVKNKIDDYDLQQNIVLKGFMKNPYGILKNSKLLCMTSAWEGFGLVAVEALSLGKPVVASNVGGLSGIVTDKCGLLCNSVNDFEEEIFKLLSDEELYKTKSDNAYNRAKELDNIDKYVEEIKHIYDSVK